MDGAEYDATHDAPMAIAAQELLPGERLQWAGRPWPWAVARRKLTFLIPALFLLIAGGIVVDLAADGVAAPGNPLAALPIGAIGALFMLLGIAFAGAPLAAAWQARGTVYAVTSLRLLVIDRVFIHRAAAFAPEDIQAIMVTNERPDGSADIVFRQDIRHVRVRGARIGIVDKIGFFGIADADRVRDLIRQMRGDVAGATPAFLSS
jgi:hypothetical protein